MDKLYLCPTDAYSVDGPQDDVLRTALDGGAGRYRTDVLNATSIVSVTWSLNADACQYLYAFLRNRASNGSDPFLIDLLLEGYAREERTVWFIPGSIKITEKAKNRWYNVTAQLEVEAKDADEDFDSSVVDVYAASQGDPETYLNLFEKIINTLP